MTDGDVGPDVGRFDVVDGCSLAVVPGDGCGCGGDFVGAGSCEALKTGPSGGIGRHGRILRKFLCQMLLYSMAKKRTWTDEQLIEAVASEKSYSAVLKRLGLKLSGGTHAHLKLHVRQLGLDTAHFTGKGWCTGQHNLIFIDKIQIPLEKILVRESTYSSTVSLKKRLLRAGLLENKCYICGGLPEWQGKPLVLQLDHVDGDRTNNLLVNLRLVCPNCHSQTPTFCGRNARRK